MRYYYYIHNGIATKYVAGMSQEWFQRIMNLVPKKLQKNEREIKRIHEEIKEDYAFAVKKSVVDFVLKEPEIDEDERFLDEVFNFFYFFLLIRTFLAKDDETPMTIELAAVSEAWKKLYRSSKRQFSFFLFFLLQKIIYLSFSGISHTTFT